MLAPPVKPGETALPWRVQPVSSAFTRSVTAALGSSEGTPSTTIQIPGTLPVSTPRQTTGSPVGTETGPTAEEFTQSSSHWTPTAPQGPSTPPFVWTLRNYKVIPATDGIRKPRLKGPMQGPGLALPVSFPVLTQALGTAGQPGMFLALKLTSHAHTLPCALLLCHLTLGEGRVKGQLTLCLNLLHLLASSS